MDCKHTITNHDGTCRDCGVQYLSTETRKCSGCSHFRSEPPFHTTGTCRKHLMRVTASLLVTFHAAEGSCYSPKTS